MDQDEKAGTVVSFLPVGSVVRLKDGDRPIVVAGCMAVDGITGRYWDYMGYPWPEGRQDASKDYFFDSGMVAEVMQIGFLDRDALDYQVLLSAASERYRAARSRQGS
ncbi:MAG: DUF4176 domain-containing protein [Coriobacteriaceae bacterium]|uniref:DUF4176 domain-containing protein n=1 Tax=Tractidigestivibacter sp. TaxID=2847320 RepID=UPI002A80A7D7|nr:DUF4176 domain-containing protein [Tractidigestivibacter sp.]MCI6274485.1 DUF4176 domain-containing protein [Coriobacteriaceae bacterium]MCI6547189.1 DUF4176 domain-containing protein [Coriobacteriaceae bacterium]MCI6843536.1 DUF4176 domain-containing protein [Coriobacteriaceae bacterium]MCI7438324.1 DUF4176 domain-containing protein [Coriobacteriaceae bacterium]MDD7584453.1 DUF4176 domain-containing protein [Coriobacteriaceae bacterium]